MTELYKDKDWLYDQYINKKVSGPKIAKECDVHPQIIYNWLRKHKIKVRNFSECKKGDLNYQWKQGIIHKFYYRKAKCPNHPRADQHGYVLEHILKLENKIGRKLKYYGKNNPNNEIVHHIDGNRYNNNPDNLFLCSNRIHHNKIHYCLEKIAFELYKKRIIKFDKNKGEYYYE